MRRTAWKLTLLGGLLLATGIACTDRTQPRASTPSTPAPAVTPVVVPDEPLTYTVVAGDFLSEIANRFEVELDDLIELNNIDDAALIEVGQVLVIPGETGTFVDPFAIEPAERWPEIYPPQELPPPPEPTPLEELRNRVAAWPWPPREQMVAGGVIAGFALTALIAGLLLTSLQYHGRRWVRRATPRAARRAFRWWGAVAMGPRLACKAIYRRAIASGRFSGRVAGGIWAAILVADRRYRRARQAVIVGWVRTRVHRERIAERARPVIDRADDFAGRAVDVTLERTREIVDNVRDRAPGAAADSFTVLGERATSVSRSVRTGAQKARRDVFEPGPQPERWRSPVAGELARAFESGQLQVRYVPVIDLDARTLSAIEAHLFWQHPQRGLMAARDIHTAAHEHPELRAALLEFLLEQSCGFLKERVDDRFPSAQLIVPITLEQIVESEPLAAIDRGLSSADLAIDRLKVSVAESYAMQDPLTAAAFIRNLRSMGIGVHLDDYSLAPAADLRNLGVSSVTVDFAAAGTSAEARELLEEAVEAAQDLRLPITARHSRGHAARDLQVNLGCSFEAAGEPLPADAFVKAHVDEPPPVAAAQPTDAPSPLAAPGSNAATPGTPVHAAAAATGAAGDEAAGAPESVAVGGSSSTDQPAAELNTTAESTAPATDRRPRRLGSPLGVSRPSFSRPNLAKNGTAEAAADAGDEPAEAGADQPTDIIGDAAPDASATGADGTSADGRPVDAA